MPRRIPCLALFLLVGGTAVAAPAPFPVRARTGAAEVVLEAGTKERLRLALLHLRGRTLRRDLGLSETLKRYLPRMGMAGDRQDWVADRLTAEQVGDSYRVRVRLVTGGSDEQAKALLAEVIREITRIDRSEEERQAATEERNAAKSRVAQLGRGGRRGGPRGRGTFGGTSSAEESLARYEFMVEPLRFVEYPRPFRPAR